MVGEKPAALCQEVTLDHDYVFVAYQEFRDADQRVHTAEIYRCLKCCRGHMVFLPLEEAVNEGA